MKFTLEQAIAITTFFKLNQIQQIIKINNKNYS